MTDTLGVLVLVVVAWILVASGVDGLENVFDTVVAAMGGER